MQFTPVVPPFPSPGGGSGSPLNPPPNVIPQGTPGHHGQTPAWAQQPAGFPAQSPYVAPGFMPGSYFIPPVTLPGGATPLVQPNQGFSMDYTGFPGPGAIPGSAAGGNTPFARPGQPPTTPYMGAGSQTAYSAFQQPLPPGGMPPGMFPMGMGGMGGMPPGMPYGTPYMPMMPGAMPPGVMGGMPGVVPGGYPFTPAAPTAPMPGGMPGGIPGAVPMQPQQSRESRFPNPKEKLPWDQAENVKFAEGEDCAFAPQTPQR